MWTTHDSPLVCCGAILPTPSAHDGHRCFQKVSPWRFVCNHGPGVYGAQSWATKRPQHSLF